MPNPFWDDPPLQPGDPRYVAVYAGGNDPIARAALRLESEPVILFCGERGSGVTTEMLRLQKLLQDGWDVQYRDAGELSASTPVDVETYFNWIRSPVQHQRDRCFIVELAHDSRLRSVRAEDVIDVVAALIERLQASGHRVGLTLPAWIPQVGQLQVEVLPGVQSGGPEQRGPRLIEMARKRHLELGDQEINLVDAVAAGVRDFLFLVWEKVSHRPDPVEAFRAKWEAPTEEDLREFGHYWATFGGRQPRTPGEIAKLRRFVDRGWLRPTGTPHVPYRIHPLALAYASVAFESLPGEPVAPPYFKSVTIGDLRCFGDQQTIDFCGPGSLRHSKWTVVLGDNGTGKTTLLRTIAFYSRLGPEQWPPASLGVTGVVIDRAGEEHRYDYYKGRISRTKLPLCFAYGAGRGVTSVSMTTETAGPCVSLFEENTPLPDPQEWLVLADFGKAKEGNGGALARRLDQIKGILREILPDVEDFEVERKGDAKFFVKAKTPYGWIPMSDLSYGYKSAITWIVDLARRMFDTFPHAPSPLAGPAVVLVDEIDLHLHPKWQRQILTLLDRTFPNVQFIVTAHSPLIVQAAPDANLVLLKREGDHVIVENDLDYIRNWRIDQVLASDLFENQPVHSEEIQALLDNRIELLRARVVDREAVRRIDRELDRLPTFSKPEDQAALDLVRETARLIREKKAG